MIRTRDDYRRYLDADREALGVGTGAAALLDDVWRFQRALRRVEFYANTRKPRPLEMAGRLWLRRQGRRLGFSIPPNVFGPGLAIAHYGTIVVNGSARVGANCCIHPSRTIGTKAGHQDAAPTIGDNAYIGPGARIFGPIILGDNIQVGANAVVTKDAPSGAVLLCIPARPKA